MFMMLSLEARAGKKNSEKLFCARIFLEYTGIEIFQQASREVNENDGNTQTRPQCFFSSTLVTRRREEALGTSLGNTV